MDDATCYAELRGDVLYYVVCESEGRCTCAKPVPLQHQFPVYPVGTLVHVTPSRAGRDGHEGGYTVVGFERGLYRLAAGQHTPEEARALGEAGAWQVSLDRLRVVHGYAPRTGRLVDAQANGCALDLVTERYTQCDGHWRCLCGGPPTEEEF